MKRIVFYALLCMLALRVAGAQEPANIYGFGGSFNNTASPAIAGTGLYAHRFTDQGTFAFTVIDALPNTLKPFTVTTNVGVGIAQRIATVGKIPIYVPTTAGISWTGANTGWAWTTGGMAAIRIKQTNWYVMPTVRVAKSSVSNGSGYQPIVGVLVGWGQ